jgi:hypothetical protein
MNKFEDHVSVIVIQDTTLYDTHAAHTQLVSKVSVRVSSCQLSKSRAHFLNAF